MRVSFPFIYGKEISMTKRELPKKYNHLELEKKWAQNWKETDVYAYNPDVARENTFVVDTPPPTVSGSLHMGHVFSYTQTDCIVRYQRMKGKNIFYPMGWDDNGLPTERRVQNLWGVKCDPTVAYDSSWTGERKEKVVKPRDQQPIGRKNFIELCQKQTKEDEIKYENLWRNLGLSIDWNQQYETINSHSQKMSQFSFLDLVSKNKVYSTEAPTMWDVTYQTAVAQAEVEDRARTGHFYDIRFGVEDGSEFLISTTRPELLAACIAVVAHPDDERYQKFFGKKAITPLFNVEVPILAAEHADPEKGTGILMVCTFGDVHDVEWWKQSDLPLKQVLGLDGKMLPVTFGEGVFESKNSSAANAAYSKIDGLFINKAKSTMVEMLSEDGSCVLGKGAALVGEPRPTQQAVKYYEKGDRPLEFVPTRQWFIKILDHREELLAQGAKVNWTPAHMKSKFDQWVKGINQDWCISRQRYFGVPFPVWYGVDENGMPIYDKPLFADISDLPVDPMQETPKGFEEASRNQPGGFTGDPNVMDTWATSSVTPQISSHWGIDEARHKKLFPADLRPQAHEIIRTWAFYTIAKSYFHEGSVPWYNAGISGWVVTPDRSKLSKSKGNSKGSPEDLLVDFSADALRYWATKAKLGVDTIYDEGVFKVGKRLCTKLFNVSKFVMMQLEDEDTPEYSHSDISNMLDLAMIKELKELVDRSNKNFEQFDFAAVLLETESLFWNFCDHYVELVKNRSYKQKNTQGGKSALATLDICLGTFLRLFAPFISFVTEEVWSWRQDEKDSTIHKASFPNASEFKEIDLGPVSDELVIAKEVLGGIRGEKTKAQKSLKWPVKAVKVKGEAQKIEVLKKVLEDLTAAGNVSENGFSFVSEKIEGESNFELDITLSESDS